MSGHDSTKQLEDLFGDAELIKKISPKFSELSLDLQEINRQCKNPMFLAVLLFKLAEEREKTNKMLEDIHDKFDQIMFKMKTSERIEGEVKIFFEFKGYGFVKGDDGKDYFIHSSFIDVSGYKYLNKNERISFKPVITNAGDQAHDIKLVSRKENLITTIKANDLIKKVLENSQSKTQQLQSQEEEMRQNLEEMQATQEEAQRREKKLESKYVSEIKELKKEADKKDKIIKDLKSKK